MDEEELIHIGGFWWMAVALVLWMALWSFIGIVCFGGFLAGGAI